VNFANENLVAVAVGGTHTRGTGGPQKRDGAERAAAAATERDGKENQKRGTPTASTTIFRVCVVVESFAERKLTNKRVDSARGVRERERE